ncbi:MAG: hypothetical protein EKK63_04655 [Acinetobacter sp.]|jgi:hypothetical protein|nr:hypothetical protein EJP75_15630 [Acinetobacter baumannii]RUP41623.1 MAG: hypothetical protein EKK63_04655 [Acinetobacter sp.]
MKSKASTPPLPANLTAPLPKLNELKGDTGGDWLDWGIDTVQKYSLCVQRVSALIEANEPSK